MDDARAPLDGLLVVDKPAGPTSHDVVARVRRLLGTRRVGHAGTLDPLASGVLVVLVGEATKLVPFLTLDDKRYEATIVLGVATTTCDAEGEVTDQRELPPWIADPTEAAARVADCLALERARREQIPPIYSAIKVHGRSAHRRARAGELLELPARPVVVHELDCVRLEPPHEPAADATARLELRMRVGKGYYVRALARDVGDRLGVPAHLGALRRTTSGGFELGRAVSLEAAAEELRAALVGLADAAALALPVATLTEAGVIRARRGQLLAAEDFQSPKSSLTPTAWLGPAGDLVAIGQLDRAGLGRVLRGIASQPPAPRSRP